MYLESVRIAEVKMVLQRLALEQNDWKKKCIRCFQVLKHYVWMLIQQVEKMHMQKY